VIDRNRLANIDVVAAAVGETPGIVRISEGGESSEGRIGDVGLEVEMVTLDSLLERGTAKPDLVKIDVEGYENEVIAGAEHLLRDVGPTLIVELHPWADDAETRRLLETAGYSLRQITPQHILAVPTLG
jgi:FkbM family methyltransferase